ncbi:hypothetical protein B0H10DRAFT_1992684, partial [Mycena sp. CBHHK59/15]
MVQAIFSASACASHLFQLLGIRVILVSATEGWQMRVGSLAAISLHDCSRLRDDEFRRDANHSSV